MDKDRDWGVVLIISALVMFAFVVVACVIALTIRHPIIMTGVAVGLLTCLGIGILIHDKLRDEPTNQT